MNFLGLDPGLVKCGFAVVEGHRGYFSLGAHGVIAPNTKLSLGARLMQIYKSIAKLLDEHRCVAVGSESPSFNSVSAPYSLGAVHGTIHLAVYEAEIPIYKVAPTQLKLFATGKGVASKAKVRLGIEKEFGFVFDDEATDDTVDAAVLAIIAGAKSVYPNHLFTKRHLAEVVHRVTEYKNFS